MKVSSRRETGTLAANASTVRTGTAPAEEVFQGCEGLGTWWKATTTRFWDGIAIRLQSLSGRRQLTAAPVPLDRALLVQAQEKAEASALALQQSELRLRVAVEGTGVGLWELDLVTLKAWRNPEHEAVFGYSQPLAQWGFETFLAHLHPDQMEPVREAIQGAIETGGHFELECQVRWPDGTEHWVDARGHVEKSASGQPYGHHPRGDGRGGRVGMEESPRRGRAAAHHGEMR